MNIAQIRKAIAAFVAPIIALPSLTAWLAGAEPFDAGTLLSAVSMGLIAAIAVYFTPNQQATR